MPKVQSPITMVSRNHLMSPRNNGTRAVKKKNVQLNPVLAFFMIPVTGCSIISNIVIILSINDFFQRLKFFPFAPAATAGCSGINARHRAKTFFRSGLALDTVRFPAAVKQYFPFSRPILAGGTTFTTYWQIHDSDPFLLLLCSSCHIPMRQKLMNIIAIGVPIFFYE